jgi:hypothetical protein
MKNPAPAILQNPLKKRCHILMTLNGGNACEFIYTDDQLANEHYDQMRSLMQICNQAIRTISFEKRYYDFDDEVE